MSPLLKVLLWLALPVAVCVWAVAHGQAPPLKARDIWGDANLGKGAVVLGSSSNPIPAYARSPARPNVPGAVLTDDVRKICRRGYSRSVRPPEWISEAYKVELLVKLPPTSAGHSLNQFELDDRVPLELGGKPGPENWWLEPLAEAHAKDREEDRIHREVCAGRIDIHDAQKYFLNWPDGMLQ